MNSVMHPDDECRPVACPKCGGRGIINLPKGPNGEVPRGIIICDCKRKKQPGVMNRTDIGNPCHCCHVRTALIFCEHGNLCQSCYLKTVTPNRDIMPLDRLEKSIAFVLDQLVDMAWSYMAGDELDKMSRELRKVYNKEPGKLAIAKEVYVLHCLFEIMHQVAVPGMEVCRDMLESLKTESVPKSRKLTLPNSRRMQLRRTIVKGLFNALRPKIDGERVDLKLGEALFASDDDSPKIN